MYDRRYENIQQELHYFCCKRGSRNCLYSFTLQIIRIKKFFLNRLILEADLVFNSVLDLISNKKRKRNNPELSIDEIIKSLVMELSRSREHKVSNHNYVDYVTKAALNLENAQ